MATTEYVLIPVIESLVEGAVVNLHEEAKYQVAFDRNRLHQLTTAKRTAAGERAVRAAIQQYVELLFAQRDVDVRTLCWWGIAMRLKDKLFVPDLEMAADGTLLPRVELTPFPIDFSPADVAWIEMHLTGLRRRFNVGEITEAEFDLQCRELFARPPAEISK